MDAYGALYQLADAAGIESQYWDIDGQLHQATPDTIRALLDALGHAAGMEADAISGLAMLEEQRWHAGLPPVILAHENCQVDVPFRLAQDDGTRTMRLSVHLETGGIQAGECDLGDLPVEGTGNCGGLITALRRVKLPPLPVGYHEIRIEAGREATTRLIVAPARCYLPPKLAHGRCWGLAAQLYALKTSNDWGIGDFGHLWTLVDRAAANDADAVGLNPLHALFLDKPEDASPYSPSSRLFRNPLYLEVTAIAEFAESDEARALIRTPETMRALQSARTAGLVDYRGVAGVKLAILECLYRTFDINHAACADSRAAAFRAFVERSGENLDRFAAFQVLSEHFGTHDWSRWPTAYRDPQSALDSDLRKRHTDRVQFFKYLQWQCEEQFSAAADLARQRGMTIGLYSDLAVSVAASSGDHWSHQDLFAGKARIGAPPDPFNEMGQEWGVVPLNPARLRATGYRHFSALLSANMRHSGALRIDHVMGWQRLFLIPAGAQPSAGAYVRYPIDDILAIAALESQRNRCMVIGEDLGTVPGGFRERMAAANILSCRIFYFERTYDRFRPPADYPALASVSAATHDLATLRGFWNSDDIVAKVHLGIFKTADEKARARCSRAAERRQLLQALADEALLPGGLSPSNADHIAWTPELALAVHQYLARTKSVLCMVQMDDLAGEAQQANLPGSTTQYPNWRRRLARSLEDLFADSLIQNETRAISAERTK